MKRFLYKLVIAILAQSYTHYSAQDTAMLKLTVFLLGLALVSGGVVDSSNVKDFEKFLRASVTGKYQEALTPELAERQSAWERSGKFEGDIVLTEEQINSMVRNYSMGHRNSILNTRQHWPNGIIYYTIRNDFHSGQVAAIQAGIREIEQKSCLRFVQRTNQANYVLVTGTNTGCWAYVGMIGGAQQLNLDPNGCLSNGIIVHEFLHAIGFQHQQCTYTRDDWVSIIWNKIWPGMEFNFFKYTQSEVTNFDIVYDYASVMHYHEWAFSIDGSKTIIPLKPTNEPIGQGNQMSPGDVRKLNLMYKCSQ